jgi:2-methylcitrate dehydratase PrpD
MQSLKAYRILVKYQRVYMTVTEKLAAYTVSLNWQNLKPGVPEQGKSFFMDGLGCMIAGANEKAPSIAIKYGKAFGGKPVASVIGKKNLKLDAQNAAIVNGIAAHFHDLDDVIVTIDGHPTVAVLPAVLAVAQIVGASGEDTIMAYITGVEILSLIGLGFNKNSRYYSIGWHATATLGIFGATAAVGWLLKLNEDQLVRAFGIAASESSGLKANFGTMVKPLHAGRCCAKAIYAAQMAKLGYNSNPSIMEGNEGLAHVTVKTIDVAAIDKSIADRNSTFLNPGLSIKPWPSCRQNHSSLDAVFSLRAKNNFKAEDVEKVECLVQPVSYDCLKYQDPKTPLEGKFSMQYNMALAIVRGRVGLADFEGDRITDPKIIDFMKKVTMSVDNSIAGGGYNNGRYDSIVKIYLKDGKVLQEHFEWTKGDLANPLSPAELMEKFNDCIARSLDMSKAEPVRDAVLNIEKVSSINVLTDAISAAALYE